MQYSTLWHILYTPKWLQISVVQMNFLQVNGSMDAHTCVCVCVGGSEELIELRDSSYHHDLN